MEIRPFKLQDETQVIQMWKKCGLVTTWNDPGKDIHRKLKVQPELFLVGCSGEQIVATVMAGYDGHRGWINYLAVDPDHQRAGMGQQIMQAAEKRLRTMGCPKINLQVRKINTDVIKFYEAIGFASDHVESLGKRLEPDD